MQVYLHDIAILATMDITGYNFSTLFKNGVDSDLAMTKKEF